MHLVVGGVFDDILPDDNPTGLETFRSFEYSVFHIVI
jgi:hypothetical protein